MAMERPYFNLTDWLDDDVDTIENEAKDYVNGLKNVNTVTKKMYWINKLEKAAEDLFKKKTTILELSPRDLNALVCKFLMSLKREDGGDYETGSIHNLFSLLNSYLKEHGYCSSLQDDDVFRGARQTKDAKVKHLKQEGKGNRPNRSEALSFEEEELMWATGAFGCETALALTRTVWYLFTLLFGLRGRHEARQMTWGDIKLQTDSNGEEYLEFNERLSKTRKGSGDARTFAPKAFKNARTDRCPITFYKEYAKRRPLEMTKDNSPFFLAINHKVPQSSIIWYMKAPLGEQSLGKLMKSGCEAAGVSGKKTNHSVRKTTTKRLLDSGCPPEYCAQLTGHKNVASLRQYAEADIKVQKTMALSALNGDAFEVKRRRVAEETTVTSSQVTTISSNQAATMQQTPGQLVLNNCTNITINYR